VILPSGLSVAVLHQVLRQTSTCNGFDGIFYSPPLFPNSNPPHVLVCANVFGLHWSTRLMAVTECAAHWVQVR